jgi:hypothetical protein
MLPRRPYGERRNDKTVRRTSLYFQQLSQCDTFAGTDRRLASFGPRTRPPESDSAHSGNGETRLGGPSGDIVATRLPFREWLSVHDAMGVARGPQTANRALGAGDPTTVDRQNTAPGPVFSLLTERGKTFGAAENRSDFFLALRRRVVTRRAPCGRRKRPPPRLAQCIVWKVFPSPPV